MASCGEYSAWFGDIRGEISDGEGAYSDSLKCRWTVDGVTSSGRKNLCVRFAVFDIEDSKKCDKTVVSLSYGQNLETFCQTLGAARDLHKRRRTMVKSFNEGNPRKYIDGQNLLSWTCLDTHNFAIEMASMPGSNPAGNYQGFEILWATEGTMTFVNLNDEMTSFATEID